MYMCMR